ncbi:MAG: hypothetical protein AAGA57_08495 [Planctomycetota bacterium]
MGYDIHITRGRDWFEAYDNADIAITAEEWIGYVKEDPELSLAGYNGDYFALWSGKCEYDDPWFDWISGVIYTKNPDEAIIDKAVQIASQLDARVIGESDEIYLGGGRVQLASETDTSSLHPDEVHGDQHPEPDSDSFASESTASASVAPKPWWRRIFN